LDFYAAPEPFISLHSLLVKLLEEDYNVANELLRDLLRKYIRLPVELNTEGDLWEPQKGVLEVPFLSDFQIELFMRDVSRHLARLPFKQEHDYAIFRNLIFIPSDTLRHVTNQRKLGQQQEVASPILVFFDLILLQDPLLHSFTQNLSEKNARVRLIGQSITPPFLLF